MTVLYICTSSRQNTESN